MKATVLVVLGLIAASARPAAACHKRHQSAFEQFDLATTVAIAKVTKVPDRGDGEVWLQIAGDKDRFKGTGKLELVARETHTSCHVGFRRGHRALVFIAANGMPVALYESYVEEFSAWEPLIRRYAAAASAGDRLAVVLDAIESSDRGIANDGAYYLVDHPELLAVVDAAARARLVAALPSAHHESRLPEVLMRLGDSHAQLAQRRFEAVTDPAKLADTVENGPDNADRIAALERCERVHGVGLYPFTNYSHGVSAQYWRTLAEGCRTGTPVKN